jgi:hypothetical protein
MAIAGTPGWRPGGDMQKEQRMSRWIGLSSIAISAVGLFFGWYFFFAKDLSTSVAIVTVTTVGITGVLAFVRHVIFHKDDAKMIGWETERPDWMFEVGFANLAFGLVALLAVVASLGLHAQAIALLGFAAYLFQAAILHGYRYATDATKNPVRLWRFCLLTALLAAMMTFFGVQAALS